MTLTPAEPSALVERLRATLFTELAPVLDAVGEWDMVDYPDYYNSGDAAIWLGQLAIAEHFGIRTGSISSFHTYDPRLLHADGPVVINGGGNFGGLYPAHQELRLKLLRDFPGRDIIQMPQSVEFTSVEYSDQLKRAIAKHGSFVLYVRDDRSFERAVAALDCDVRHVPDAAFAIGGLVRRPATSPLAVQTRTDDEKGESSAPPEWETFDWREADRWEARAMSRAVMRKTRGLGRALHLENALGIDRTLANLFARLNVEKAVSYLSRGDLLVTDRLHGHIIAELLRIPHVTVNDRYGKIQEFWERWTPDTEYGTLVTTWPDAVAEVARRKAA